MYLRLCRFHQHVAVVVCLRSSESSDVCCVPCSSDAHALVLLQPHDSHLRQQYHYGNAVSVTMSVICWTVPYHPFYVHRCGLLLLVQIGIISVTKTWVERRGFSVTPAVV